MGTISAGELVAPPAGSASLDALADRLRALREAAGNPSYAEIVRRVAEIRRSRGVPDSLCHPGRTTVYECFRPGRRRVDLHLLGDIVDALGVRGDAATAWRRAYGQAQRGTGDRQGAMDVADADLIEPSDGHAPGSAIGAVTVRRPPAAPQTGFVGRRRERSLLRRLGATSDAPTVAVIDGVAGIGKSQLALRVAADLRRERRFSESVQVDLRGFDPRYPPVAPVDAVSAVLRAIGVPGEEFEPLAEPARIDLCKDRLGGRALLVLDDAASAEQLTPILDAVRGCVVVITSHRKLPEVTDAWHVSLSGLGDSDARRLIASYAGPGSVGRRRVDREPDAAQRLLDLCGRRPLDLSVAGAHISAQPTWSLADHAAWLAAVRRDEAVRPALTACYRSLRPELQVMLRRLALHPGATISVHASAALCLVDLRAARTGLNALVRENMLVALPRARYAFHDVILGVAHRLAVDTDPQSARHAALARLLDFYCHTAASAMAVLEPHVSSIRAEVQIPASPVLHLRTPDQAHSWLDEERGNILAAAHAAVAAGLADRAALLAAILGDHWARTSRWNDAAQLHRAALAASDPGRRTGALLGLGGIDYRMSRYPEAIGRFRQALATAREIGDRRMVAAALNSLGATYQRVGDTAHALEIQEQALAVAEDLGDRELQAKTHANMAVVLDDLAQFQQGLVHAHRARDLFAVIGDVLNAARVDGNMAMTYEGLGRYDEAKACHMSALQVAREAGDLDTEAGILASLAVVRARLGDMTHAIADARRAIEIFTDLHNRSGEAYARGDLADVLVRAGRPSEALGEIATAEQVAVVEGWETLRASLLNTRGAALRALGRPNADSHARARALADRANSDVERAHAELGLAHAALDAGDRAGADRHARHAYDIYARIGLHDAEAVKAEFPAVAEPGGSTRRRDPGRRPTVVESDAIGTQDGEGQR